MVGIYGTEKISKMVSVKLDQFDKTHSFIYPIPMSSRPSVQWFQGVMVARPEISLKYSLTTF